MLLICSSWAPEVDCDNREEGGGARPAAKSRLEGARKPPAPICCNHVMPHLGPSTLKGGPCIAAEHLCIIDAQRVTTAPIHVCLGDFRISSAMCKDRQC